MIYVVSYHTESGDRGVVGYFKKKPTDKQLRAWFEKNMPDEFEDGHAYVYWQVDAVKELK